MASIPFKWRALLSAYHNSELKFLRFSSEEEIVRAIHLCWNDPELVSMPRDYRDALTMEVPQEAVELFQMGGLNFRVSEYLTGADYRSAELIEREDGSMAIDDFFTKYWTKNPRRINFFEKGGALWFKYEERVLDLKIEWRERWKIYKTEGEIPQAIVAKGEEAIKAHVEEVVTDYLIEARDQEAKHEAYASNLDFPVSFQHQGVLLNGKIVSGFDNTLVVRLEEPYQGERSVHFGFGSAIAGRFIFDREGNLTQAAVETAQRWMVYIYEEQYNYEQNKDIVDLANNLNGPKIS